MDGRSKLLVVTFLLEKVFEFGEEGGGLLGKGSESVAEAMNGAVVETSDDFHARVKVGHLT